MRRELIGWELGKLWSFPGFPVFLLLCFIFNVVSLASDWELKAGGEYARYVDQAAKKTGTWMGEEFDRKAADLPEHEYKDIFLEETAGAGDIFASFDPGQSMEVFIGKFGMKGFAAKALREKAQKLKVRIEELDESNASMSLAAAGMTKKMLDALFLKCCRAVITEAMLWAVFMALYVCGNEKLNRTGQMVYATRKGKGIQKEKALAALISALAAYGLLLAGTLLAYTVLWQPGTIWQACMSSQFYYVIDLGQKLPFVSYADFSVEGYFAAAAAMGAVVVWLFHILGMLGGMLAGDVYKGFLGVFLLAALNMEAIMLAGNNGLWGIFQVLQWTPAAFWWSQPLWFSELSASALATWQECRVAAVSVVVWGMLAYTAYRYFYKREV